jgi:tight adherence protein B
MTVLAVAVAAATAAIGLLLIWSAWTTPPPPSAAPRSNTRRAERARLATQAAIAIAGALVGLVVTGWVIAAAAGAVAGWAVVAAWRRRASGGRRDQARIEALASWCEQLRDLLSAEHGVLGTVQATVETCPMALRPEVSRLATRLSRQEPSRAVRQFAAEVDDPSGDLVASVLLLAMSRSGRTAELLSELAVTIRERASMRLRVEAERSGQRAEARLVIGLGAVVIGGVLIFGRGSSFLDAYDSATGQLVLALVAALYGAGMYLLARLTRFERPARFLSVVEVDR